jgi:DNA-binding LacI/PurR family transcriptional regulator
MPKQIMDGLVRNLERSIRTNYKSGDRFLTVHAIAEQFGISYATAFKAVRTLTRRGLLIGRQGSGLRIGAEQAIQGCATKKIAVLSRFADEGFNKGFLWGIEEVARPEKVSVELVVNTFPNVRSILFGDYIAGLGADGVIALSFGESALAFYRAMIQGVDLVADIALEELPMLPVVQTDNYRHGADAAVLMAQCGYRKALLLAQTSDPLALRGFFHQRVEGFCDSAKRSGIATSVAYLHHPAFFEQIDRHFEHFGTDSALFSTDLSCNHLATTAFLKHHIAIKNNNLVVYDGQSEFLLQRELPPITTVGPSLKELGRGLATKLLDKWKSGSFSEPPCQLI